MSQGSNMILHRVEDCTLSELLEAYRNMAAEMYIRYQQAIKGSDEQLKDDTYKQWAHADDCLINLTKIVEMVRSDNIV